MKQKHEILNSLSRLFSKSLTPPVYLVLLRTLTIMQMLPVSHDALQLHLQDPTGRGQGNSVR